MPKRKRAKTEYKPVYLFSRDGQTAYSDSAFQRLARNYGFADSNKLAEAKKRLEGAAQVYRNWKRNYSDAPRPGESRAAIDAVEQSANELLSALQKMDSATADLFWEPEIKLLNNWGNLQFTESKYGHQIERLPAEGGGYNLDCLWRDDHFASLNILLAYCKAAKERLPKDKGGPRSDEPLRMWAINIQAFWEQFLGRRFTLDREKGKPISPAANFCVDAFKSIDPTIRPSRVMNAMSKVIEDARESAARRPKTPPV